MRRKTLLNIPNYITFGRLIAVIVVMVLMLFLDDRAADVGKNMALSLAAAAIFLIAMISDVLDGYLARRWGLSSNFGRFMDPLADKVMVLTAMTMMIPLGRMPAWLVVLFMVREVVVTSLRGIAIGEGVMIAASKWGKYKVVFVTAAITGIMIHYPFFGIQWRLVGWALMVPAFVFTWGSGFHYIVGFLRGHLRPEGSLT